MVSRLVLRTSSSEPSGRFAGARGLVLGQGRESCRDMRRLCVWFSPTRGAGISKRQYCRFHDVLLPEPVFDLRDKRLVAAALLELHEG